LGLQSFIAAGVMVLALIPGLAQAQTVQELNDQDHVLFDKGQYAQALDVSLKALALSRKTSGPDTALTADCLLYAGEAYQVLGDNTNAEAVFLQCMQICKTVLGPEHPDTVVVMDDLGSLYTTMGRYSKAESLLQQALNLNDKPRALHISPPSLLRVDITDEMLRGRNNLSEARSLTDLGRLYQAIGEYSRAESYYQQSYDITKRLLGAEDRRTAVRMSDLADIEMAMGNYGEAKPLLEAVLAMDEKLLGENHPNVGAVLQSLGRLNYDMGDYSKAESDYDRSRTILESNFGEDSLNTAGTLSGLAMLYMSMGDYVKAWPLIQRTLQIDEKTLGPEHQSVAHTLDEMAEMYAKANNFPAAQKLDEQVVSIDEKALGMETPQTAAALLDLGTIYLSKGDFSKAKANFEQAIGIQEKVLGPEHPDLATGLSDLSIADERMGDFAKAEALEERALEIDEKSLGDENPSTANILEGLALTDMDLQKTNEAVQFAQRTEESRLTLLNNILSFTSEQQRLNFEVQNEPCNLFASLGDTADLAQTVLRHKGVVLDSLLEDHVVALASSDPDYKKLVEVLEPAKRQLTQLSMTVPKDFSAATLTNRFNEYEKLSSRVDELEGDLARDVAGFGQAREALAVTSGQVQQAIPAQAALVEFVYYNHYLGRSKWERRYGAVIFSATGSPAWVCLGAADEIDKTVIDYQIAVRSDQEGKLTRAIHKLYKTVWQPVEAAFPPDTKITILSPDGTLNFVSFATLVADDNHFLAEKYSFRYVASGRDLLRQMTTVANRDLDIFAAPDYYAGGQVNWPQTGIVLDPLPTTETEALEVGNMAKAWGWNTEIYSEGAATEAQARAVQSPYVLEFATHGFVLPMVIRGPEKYSLLGFPEDAETPVRVILQNPMSRSGVALAGAQVTLDAWERGEVPPTESDGILTAEEVGGMNLQGTWLVVLSACDTGVGTPRYGEGVMGLRRGFVQAGAQNLLMTLWPVYDNAGSQIIKEFYAKVHDDNNPPQALAEVQRDWLVKLRGQGGLLDAISLAGPFIMSSQGPVR
jgi:tetratricopeptide (TPR) repeat protein